MNKLLAFLALFAFTPFLVIAQPEVFKFTPTNLSGQFYGTLSAKGFIADTNDWVAAIGENGICAGAAQLIVSEDTAYIALTIYGDDPLSPEIDEGINTDELFSLWLFDEEKNTLIPFIQQGDTVMFAGWQNANGAPIPGYDTLDKHFEFSGISTSSQPLIPAPSFSIYPNPAHEQVWIQWEPSIGKPTQVSILNLIGQIEVSKRVSTVESLQAQVSIPTENLTNGIYYIHIKHHNAKRFSRKLVILHD